MSCEHDAKYMDVGGEGTGHCVYCRCLAAEAKVRQLEEELTEELDMAFRQIAHYGDDGWWDTLALSTAVDLGDRLAELGTWERRADGVGRVQFYRPVKTDV